MDRNIAMVVGGRREVMSHVEKSMLQNMDAYLKPVEENWQPADLLPDFSTHDFVDQVKELQESSRNLSYDTLSVLIGDTITEEALPTYESWLMMVDDVNREESSGWIKWLRAWTAEENRHGDALNKYLYLTGRVNMRMMEISIQFLLKDGLDIGTGRDPYRNFIYTSFQELATNVSHRRVASKAKLEGDQLLSKMCGTIASDEARHAKAYKSFMSSIFEVDPNEAVLAFEDMMRKKIAMPANLLRELGNKIGETYTHFTDAAQRMGVYTAKDYVDILDSLIKEWRIEYLVDLNDVGEKARDYLMTLPQRLLKVAERTKIPPASYKFSWILG